MGEGRFDVDVLIAEVKRKSVERARGSKQIPVVSSPRCQHMVLRVAEPLQKATVGGWEVRGIVDCTLSQPGNTMAESAQLRVTGWPNDRRVITHRGPVDAPHTNTPHLDDFVVASSRGIVPTCRFEVDHSIVSAGGVYAGESALHRPQVTTPAPILRRAFVCWRGLGTRLYEFLRFVPL